MSTTTKREFSPVTATEAAKKLSEFMGKIKHNQKRYVVEKHGKPWMVMVPISDFPEEFPDDAEE